MQNERALKPKGRDKWALIGRAVGTTNALQPFAVESRQRAMYARVHLEPHVDAVIRAPAADQPSSQSLPPSPVSIPVPAIARPMTSPAAASYSAGGGIDGRFRHPAAAFLLQRSDVARAAPSNSW